MLIWRSGTTQTRVADAMGLDTSALGKKLRGKNGWALQELIDLAATLNTSVSYLVGETEEAPQPEGPTGGLETGSKTPESGTPLYHLPRVVHVDFAASKMVAA